MRIPRTLSHFLFTLVLFVSSLSFIPERAYASAASEKAAKARIVKILKANPKAKKAFHDWILHLQLKMFFEGLWNKIYSIPPHLAGVVQCIKDHESGNYAESSHPSSGSGAYQYVPGTWRHYFTLWATSIDDKRYFSYAFQAPPEVQDAVLVYTLTHGGAGNWSNAYGYDPCTSGM